MCEDISRFYKILAFFNKDTRMHIEIQEKCKTKKRRELSESMWCDSAAAMMASSLFLAKNGIVSYWACPYTLSNEEGSICDYEYCKKLESVLSIIDNNPWMEKELSHHMRKNNIELLSENDVYFDESPPK